MQLKDLYIQEQLETILQVLKSDLSNKGIFRFETIKQNGNNVQTNCPFHKEGQEKKPSFGIREDDGKCHCFTCGWAGSLDEMISNIHLKYDEGKYGKQWLMKHFSSTEIESRPLMTFGGRYIDRNNNGSTNRISNRSTSNDDIHNYISREELEKYRYIHPYMYERGLTDEIIEEFDIGYDEVQRCITFPVYDVNKNLSFIARRSVDVKFFNYPADVEKPVYEAWRFVSGKYKTALVVESFLNCLTAWKYGIPSVALIGTGTKEQYEILRILPVRKYILALDPDEAGRKGQQRFKKYLSKYKQIQELVYEDERDINDLQEEFLDLKII